jgi:hypothetical protein
VDPQVQAIYLASVGGGGPVIGLVRPLRSLMRTRLALIAASSSFALACTAGYTGDGTFVDHGPLAATDRYILDLGPVDLTQMAQYRYRLAGLPNDQMVAGIEVIEAEPNVDTRPNHPARIRLKVESAARQVVILEEDPLNSWAWSYGLRDPKSFYYRSGQTQEVPIRSGVTTSRRMGEKPDGGWGTYFTPRKNTTYTLTLDVFGSESSPSRPARLKISGGGWK